MIDLLIIIRYFCIVSKLDITDRLAFLAEKFDIFESKPISIIDGEMEEDVLNDSEFIEAKSLVLQKEGWEVYEVEGNFDGLRVIAILSTKSNKRGFPIKRVSVLYDVFTAMVGADPTPNKISLQWMLNTFVRLVKNREDVEAMRFCGEDLPQANEYLMLFEANKRKKKFREMAQYSLKDIKDITNINEYRNLGQLFDAVDPFIIRDPSEMESLMNRYVNSGQAKIPVRDRRFTVYVPLTRDASTIFNNFASWCTAKNGNGMFESYTTGNKKPNGDNSTLYIVIDNGFFNGENENIYQIHFETNQIHDRGNSTVDLYEMVLSKSEALVNYFGSELMVMAKGFNGGMDSNRYIDSLISFGFTEVLFDFFDEEALIISIDSQTSIKKRKVPTIPDISRFKNITHFIILDSSLHTLHPSIGSLTTLRNLAVPFNNIKEIPSEIGKLSNLLFLNLFGNPISVIPDEIKYLDKTMGGKLDTLVIDRKKISEVNYQKLKKLLPTTTIN